MSKILVGILFVSSLFVGTAAEAGKRAPADGKKACMDRCFKEYSKCRQPRTGKNICQTQKQRCEKACR